MSTATSVSWILIIIVGMIIVGIYLFLIFGLLFSGKKNYQKLGVDVRFNLWIQGVLTTVLFLALGGFLLVLL